MEDQLLDHTFIDVVTVEKRRLELCEEVANVIFKNSCVCKCEDVNSNTIFKLRHIEPHSYYFLHIVFR